MTLRNKISIIVILLWGLLATIVYVGSHRVILNSYTQLENQSTVNNLARANGALDQWLLSLKRASNDWGVWDDTYQFVQDKNQDYIKANLLPTSLASLDVDFMIFFNKKGEMIDSIAVNADRTETVPLPKELNTFLNPKGKLVYQPTVDSQLTGLINIPSGMLMVASRSIVTSHNKGPVEGTLIIGKYLTDNSFKEIQKITRVDTQFISTQEIEGSSFYQTVFKNLEQTHYSFIIYKENNTNHVYQLLKDINGNPIGLLTINLPRDIYLIGKKSIYYSNIALLIYSIVVTILLWFSLQLLIVKRLEKLASNLKNTKSNEKFFYRLMEKNPDEISTVATLYHHATHDPLTGLANRNMLYQSFDELTQSPLTGKIVFIFIDLDHFKRINDTLGHEIGDQLLISVAQKIKSTLRGNDLAVRLGGDEFVIMLANIQSDNIKPVTERIFNQLKHPFYINHHEIYISCSMGVSIYPDDGNQISILLKQADIALYQAKEKGRNHYQYYSYELSKAITEAHKREIELQAAIDNKELQLYYQPIYNTTTLKIQSVEVLLRWNHPTEGLLPAMEIIPLAEKTGLINPIGEWVIQTACQQAKTWLTNGIPLVPLAVNISALQTKYASIQALVVDALTKSNLSPNFLELELTETGFIEITPNILNELLTLRKMGIHLAVDDFGAGYSGLGYLKSLPVSKLKIDKSFIHDMHINHDDRAITLSIIAIAHQLNLEVIAEGVENQDQLEFLKFHQVDFVQGNFLSPPLKAEDFELLLKKLHEKLS